MLRSGQQEDLQPEEVHHALKYGAPSTEHLRFSKNFVVSYDSRLRNPRWVMEHITRKQTKGEGNRQALCPSPIHLRALTNARRESVQLLNVCHNSLMPHGFLRALRIRVKHSLSQRPSILGVPAGRNEEVHSTDMSQTVLLCRKNVEFYEDKGLDVRFRSRLADFRDSGYDRGHMVTPPCHQCTPCRAFPEAQRTPVLTVSDYAHMNNDSQCTGCTHCEDNRL